MNDPWLPLLKNLSLTRAERAVIKNYESDPMGRGFIQIAEIFKSHNLNNECLEVLIQGVERHPNFAVARVILAREFYHRGLVDQAWQSLDDQRASYKENVLAQKLKFKIAVLSGQRTMAFEIMQTMKFQQMLDDEFREFSPLIADPSGQGFLEIKKRILREFQNRGITPTLSLLGTDSTIENTDTTIKKDKNPIVNSAVEEPFFQQKSGEALAKKIDYAPPLSSELLDYYTPVIDSKAVFGFFVNNVQEIFKPGSLGAEGVINHGKKGIELDSTTLAEIYQKQGHLQKSLEIYKRLLRLSPGNDFIKRKVHELSILAHEERVEDLSIDTKDVDKWESIEMLDRQIKFLENLLDKV